MKRYVLEVCAPGCGYDVLHTIESDQPFMAIAPGSTLDQREWGLDLDLTANGEILRVTAVCHLVSNLGHKVRLFTAKHPNTPEEVMRDCGPH